MTPIAYNQSYFDGGTEPHPAGYTDYERNTNKVYVGESSVSALITIGDALSVLQTYDDNHFYRGD